MKLHIYEALVSYKKKRAARFHMPGHKANRRLFSPFRDAALDVTELSFSDSLESPASVIADAQEDIAAILGAQRSYILTDGATAGIFAMLYAVRSAGREGRCCALLAQERVQRVRAVGRGAVYFTETTRATACCCRPAPQDVEAALSRDAKIGAVLLTSPDYYGNTADLAAVRKVCDRFGKPLFVDGRARRIPEIRPRYERGIRGQLCKRLGGRVAQDHAHAHAGRAAECIGRGARPRTRRGAGCLPHDQPVLSDHGVGGIRRKIPCRARRGTHRLPCGASWRSRRRGSQSAASPVTGGSKTLVFAVDFGALGISPAAAYEELERRGVFAELCDGRYVLFYLSPLTAPAQIARMERAVRAVARTAQPARLVRGAARTAAARRTEVQLSRGAGHAVRRAAAHAGGRSGLRAQRGRFAALLSRRGRGRTAHRRGRGGARRGKTHLRHARRESRRPEYRRQSGERADERYVYRDRGLRGARANPRRCAFYPNFCKSAAPRTPSPANRAAARSPRRSERSF